MEKATEEVASVVISPSSDSFKHDLEEVTRKVDERRAHEMESYHKLVNMLACCASYFRFVSLST